MDYGNWFGHILISVGILLCVWNVFSAINNCYHEIEPVVQFQIIIDAIAMKVMKNHHYGPEVEFLQYHEAERVDQIAVDALKWCGNVESSFFTNNNNVYVMHHQKGYKMKQIDRYWCFQVQPHHCK